MTSKFGSKSDRPVICCEASKPLVSSFLQKNPVANCREHFRHQPGLYERKGWAKNHPAAGIDVLIGILVSFCNMEFAAFQIVKAPFAGHQRDLPIRLMSLDEPFDMPSVIPVVGIEISDRIKAIRVRENPANGARRITHVRVRPWQDYVHCFWLLVKLRLWMPIGN